MVDWSLRDIEHAQTGQEIVTNAETYENDVVDDPVQVELHLYIINSLLELNFEILSEHIDIQQLEFVGL